MAIALLIEIPGGTQEQYDATLCELGLPGPLPEGQLYHLAGSMEGGWRIVDVWESQEAFDRFYQTRLRQALQKGGMRAFQPKMFPVHNIMKP